ncbi:MAG: urease accessory protein [Dehalococcoidia bacterium]|nr:urease accessory protein [Dehalococcoidia bacterium]
MGGDGGFLTALVLGLLLGLKHATEADHVAAVSTIVSEYRNPWRAVWVGLSWGLGHTTPLLIAGIAILVFRGSFLRLYDTNAHYLELAVGAMLVLLGLQVCWNLWRRRLHLHGHAHQPVRHTHVHSHELTQAHGGHHRALPFGKPFFRPKSFVVGTVHGMAGSAAVMLVMLADGFSSFSSGLVYLLLFGIGTMISMGVLTVLIGFPFALASRTERLKELAAALAGSSSIVIGALVMYEVALA